MVSASGTAVELRWIEEVTRNVAPTAVAYQLLRATQRNINLEKEVLTTEEVRGSRQIADERHGFNTVTGPIGVEFSRGNYDAWLAYLLMDTDIATSGTPTTWRTVTQVTGVTAAASPTQTSIWDAATYSAFGKAAEDWAADGFRPGSVIASSGGTGSNNGRWTVVAIDAANNELIVYDPDDDISDEATVIAIDLDGSYIQSGRKLQTISIERAFTDITQYQINSGVALNTLELNVSTDAMVNGTFGTLGMSATAMVQAPASSSVTPPVASSPYAPFDGLLLAGQKVVAVVTGMTLNVNNQHDTEAVVGSKFSPDVFIGTQDVTGQVTAFFENEDLYNHFYNEDEVAIAVRFDDPDGTNFQAIQMSRVKFNTAPIDPAQQGPIVQTIDFRALEDTAYPPADPAFPNDGATITWQKSA